MYKLLFLDGTTVKEVPAYSLSWFVNLYKGDIMGYVKVS